MRTDREEFLRLLDPPLPSWQVAANRFWESRRLDPGMPSSLTVICSDGASTDLVTGSLEHARLEFGSGQPSYVIYSDGQTLSEIFCGAADFYSRVFKGAIGVRGTLAQLSVMVGAMRKARQTPPERGQGHRYRTV